MVKKERSVWVAPIGIVSSMILSLVFFIPHAKASVYIPPYGNPSAPGGGTSVNCNNAWKQTFTPTSTTQYINIHPAIQVTGGATDTVNVYLSYGRSDASANFTHTPLQIWAGYFDSTAGQLHETASSTQPIILQSGTTYTFLEEWSSSSGCTLNQTNSPSYYYLHEPDVRQHNLKLYGALGYGNTTFDDLTCYAEWHQSNNVCVNPYNDLYSLSFVADNVVTLNQNTSNGFTVASTTLPFAKIIFPESDSGDGAFYTLHSGDYKFKYQIYTPDNAYVFINEGDQTDHQFNNLTTSTVDYLVNEGYREITKTIHVVNGQATFYRATVQSESDEFKNFLLYYDVLGDDTKPTTATERPQGSSDNQFTCIIPYISWDPCAQLQYAGKLFGTETYNIASTTLAFVINTKPIKYGFQIKDAIYPQLIASSTATTTLDLTIPFAGKQTQLFNATSTLSHFDTSVTHTVRKWGNRAIYLAFAIYCLTIIL